MPGKCGQHAQIALRKQQCPDPGPSPGVYRHKRLAERAFGRLVRCYERHALIINAVFDLANAIVTVRSLIRQAHISHRWDGRSQRRR
jgi:hypothetical protein